MTTGEEALYDETLQSLDPPQPVGNATAAWFLGPKGENADLLRSLLERIVAEHERQRKSTYHQDPIWVTKERRDQEYHDSVDRLRQELDKLLVRLGQSPQHFSYRYQGHMLWDVSLAGIAGWMAAMLYNQNNVAAEASPVTTAIEERVGEQLSELLGYDPKGTPKPWGHITADGSIANIEALWVARNLKCYPFAVRKALTEEDDLPAQEKIRVSFRNGGEASLSELDAWQLANLHVDAILNLPKQIEERLADESRLKLIDKYTLQQLGIARFAAAYPEAHLERMAILSPGTNHYSWPKGSRLLGMGERTLVNVAVDEAARMDMEDLEQKLSECMAEKRPVVAVVAVMGSTQEGAVDPLTGILELRSRLADDVAKGGGKGLDFPIHCDAAWGGYFASMLREPTEVRDPEFGRHRSTLPLKAYVEAQLQQLPQADSITVDPHKSGFVPYPSGGLCYRNGAMPQMIRTEAPVVDHGKDSIARYALEGSKPGAAAAAVRLSHQQIPPDQSGYGRLLGRCLFNSTRLYAALATMVEPSDEFVFVPLQQVPAVNRSQEYLERFADPSLDNARLLDWLADNPAAAELFGDIGSDLLIIAYAFNFNTDAGLNEDPALANQLNKAIYSRLSIDVPGKPAPPMIVTHSQFDRETYGDTLVRSFTERFGLDWKGAPIDYLISTTMDPWLTDTANGSMIPTLVDVMKKTVKRAIDEVKAQGGGIP